MTLVPGRLPGGGIPGEYSSHRAGDWRPGVTSWATCHGNRGFSIVQYVIANGKSRARHLCLACDRMMAHDLPYSELEAQLFPLRRDTSAGECERCGRTGTEYHHWAPQAVFIDADLWPTAWLCPKCHGEWHRVMRIAGAPQRSAGAA
jgi:hypothetical protein